jgi:hypothetical protein
MPHGSGKINTTGLRLPFGAGFVRRGARRAPSRIRRRDRANRKNRIGITILRASARRRTQTPA